MKKNQIKRWLGILLALCLAISIPLTALAADNLAEGDTLPEISLGDTMAKNYGTVESNNNIVIRNEYTGTVEKNTSTGRVMENYGTVENNEGLVNENTGTVTDNNRIVTTNRGMVENNNNDATVEKNHGTVNVNHGKVIDNFYTVKTNNGTVTTNYYNATVETNYGTVTTNLEGGTVTDNYGTVTDNQGIVTNNYGGTVGGTSATNNYYKLTYDNNTVTVSGLTEKNGNFYIFSTDSVTLTPISGQHFTSVTITPEGATLTENEDGTYTLSGVTENVELTVVAIDHTYGTEWKSDGINHWHECECGAKSGETAHSYSTEWKFDGTNHWHECECGAKSGETAHSYSTEWKSDGTNHWHECECGAKSEETAHSGGTATCTKKAICTVCGEEYGELAAHTYGTEWKSDGTNHWRECECGAKTEEAAHSGGTATCENKAVCSTCEAAYGELAAHTYKDGKCTVCKTADPNYKPPTTDTPQTGDNSNMVLWFALLLISGGAVIALTADRKRKSANK